MFMFKKEIYPLLISSGKYITVIKSSINRKRGSIEPIFCSILFHRDSYHISLFFVSRIHIYISSLYGLLQDSQKQIN